MLKVARHQMTTSAVYDRQRASAPGLAYYSLPEASSSSSQASHSSSGSTKSLPEQRPSSQSHYTHHRASIPEPGPSSRSQHPPLSEAGPSSRSRYPPTSLESTHWEPCIQRTPVNCSLSTLENARYSLESDPKPDHPNEDQHFALENRTFKVFAVFDGHDGGRAAGFASYYMRQLFSAVSWERAVTTGGEIIAQAMDQFFRTTDKEFFNSIRQYITEVQSLKSVIPPGLKSFEAYQRYPYEVSRLQQLEPKLAGGCTAAVAVLANNMLYVANVGDSRVLIIKEKPNGTLEHQQLTKDDSIESEDELWRLESLGLQREDLLKAGRLGTQENTRSIGDYYIKEGYRDVDSLSSARAPPGICAPHIVGVPVDPSFRYLVLMSDGVYKSIESTFADRNLIEGNKVLTGMINHVLRQVQTMDSLADNVLLRLMQTHEDCYYTNARKDPRSPLATACRKRDDMTLILYKFPIRRSSVHDLTSPK